MVAFGGDDVANVQIKLMTHLTHHLAKAGNIPCDLGGVYSPPYQGGVGDGHA